MIPVDMNQILKQESQSSLPGQTSPGKEAYFTGKPDSEIWRMFRTGHEGAFRYIYDTYLDLLFHYGSHMTFDREMIKDCIHDLFIELRQGKKIADTDSIKFYLLKAFRWKLQRTINRKQKLFFVREMPVSVEIEASFEAKLIDSQVDQETRESLNKALGSLSGRQKEALYYFYYHDLNYQQVASMMNFSNIKSARNLIYKSIDTLKEYFKRID